MKNFSFLILMIGFLFSNISLLAQNECQSTTITPTTNSIIIDNIPQGNFNTKIEYSGPSTGWVPLEYCNGTCNTSEEITGLTDGNYTIKVQTFAPVYCYYQEIVNVNPNNSGGGSGGTVDCSVITSWSKSETCDNNGTTDPNDDTKTAIITASGNSQRII